MARDLLYVQCPTTRTAVVEATREARIGTAWGAAPTAAGQPAVSEHTHTPPTLLPVRSWWHYSISLEHPESTRPVWPGMQSSYQTVEYIHSVERHAVSLCPKTQPDLRHTLVCTCCRMLCKAAPSEKAFLTFCWPLCSYCRHRCHLAVWSPYRFVLPLSVTSTSNHNHWVTPSIWPRTYVTGSFLQKSGQTGQNEKGMLLKRETPACLYTL